MILSIVTMRLSSTVKEIWRLKDNGVRSLIFWGHVTSLVTWPFDSRVSIFYGWPWPFVVLSGRLFQEQSLVVGRSVGPQYYTDLIYYVRNV